MPDPSPLVFSSPLGLHIYYRDPSEEVQNITVLRQMQTGLPNLTESDHVTKPPRNSGRTSQLHVWHCMQQQQLSHDNPVCCAEYVQVVFMYTGLTLHQIHIFNFKNLMHSFQL